MRIKKVSQTTPVTAQVVDGYSTSTTDAYSANYVNGLNTYSTTEQRIGTWIDGKPIYRRVIWFNYAQVPSNATIVLADTSSWNIDMAIKIYGMLGYQAGYGTQTTTFRPMVLASGGTDDIRLDIDSGSLRIRTYSNWSGWDRNFVVVEYTKTTD